MWPVVSDNLPGALPTEFSLGPVGASVWRVGSAPGDSKGRPGLRTWLLVHLWELRPGFSPSRGNKFCSAWALKGQVSAAHTPQVSRIWGTLYEERRVDNNGNKLIDWCPRGSWLSWVSPETKDRRGWPFPLFKVLLPVWVLGAGEGAVLEPLKVQSHDAEVIPPQSWCENDPGQQEEEEEMAASQVNVLIQVRGCVCFFLLKYPGLKTYNSLILFFWYSCLVRWFSTTKYCFFFYFYESQSGSSLSTSLFSLSASRLPTGHEAFPVWINNFQFFKIFPFPKTNKGRHWCAEFLLGWGGVAMSQTGPRDCTELKQDDPSGLEFLRDFWQKSDYSLHW